MAPRDRLPPPKPPPSHTDRRAEIEQARRTAPVQAVRSQMRRLTDDDQHIRLLAEALKRLLRQK